MPVLQQAIDFETDLGSRNKQRELLYFIFKVLVVDDSRKVKHFRAFVNLGPESVFEQFFGLAKILLGLKLIQMRKDAHHLWKTMCLQNIQKFEGFHFKTEFGVDA
jgi:hypothetical protein